MAAPTRLGTAAGGRSSSLVTTFNWQFTLGAGANRILLVGVATDASSGNASDGASSLVLQTSDGSSTLATFTKAVEGVYSTRSRCGIWYLLEDDLPAAGTYRIEGTAPGGVGWATGAQAYQGAKQAAPTLTGHMSVAVLGTTTSITINSVPADCLVFDAGSNSYEPTDVQPTAGQTELLDMFGTPGVNTVAIGELFPAAGNVTVSWANVSWATPERMTAAAVVIEGAPADVETVVETLAPNAIAASTNLTGAVGTVQSNDGSWLNATSATAATAVRVTYPTPS